MKRNVFIVIMLVAIVGISSILYFSTSANSAEPYIMGIDIYSSEYSALTCRVDSHAFNEVMYLPASLLFFERTLDGLESRATHIVRGRVKDDAQMTLRHDNDFRPEVVTGGSNLVSFEIYDVFQGYLNVGDIITIIEPYWIENGTLYTIFNYMPSIPNEEYIFFLSAQRTQIDPEELYGAFPVIHGDRGRYRVPSASGIQQADIQMFSEHDSSEQDLIMGHLSVGTSGSMELYTYLWNEVMDAFLE